MKHCTTCQHLFPDQLQACPNDNGPLRLIWELEPGMIVRNKYIILEWIGAGGMAAVYRASHRLLNELRAVKVVFAKFSRDEDFLRRFRHEAAIARRLRHENAVWVEDLDEIEDGRPFIAMEFLEGDDLRKLIKEQGPLSVERTLKLGSQVASALSAAHKLGIVHRDIKPDNIFITRDSSGNETAKVLDFGIAKAREGVLQGGYTATKTGVIIGTPEYMSPEQAEGHLSENLDGRADIYSLGIVLYEMLTGKLPFESDTPLGMCMHHLQTVPRPPHELRPDLSIPEAVSAVLMKALEKQRERRFQTADEMLAALRNPSAFAGNGTGAFAATKVFGARTDDQPTAALASSVAAAAAQLSPANAPAKSAPAKIESPKPIEVPAPAVRTGAFAPIPLHDKGKRLRIAMVAIVVVVCAVIGYMLLKVNARRNAALQEHDVALHDLIAGKLQSSQRLQGKAQNITITVNSDAVTLSGNVPLPGDKEEAGNVARSVSGVSNVVNNIEVAGAPAVTNPAPENSSTSVSAASSNDSTHDNGVPQASRSSASGNSGVKKSVAARSQTNANLARSQATTLIKLGNQKLDDGKYAAAIADFQQALRLDRNNSEARAGLDRAHRAQKTEEELEKK